MMSIKCSNCGASITDDSKFCKYCGEKIDDGVKRIEVKVDKRIEDVAEVRRAEYEEKESMLRQKKMERELKKEKAQQVGNWFRRIILLLIFIVSICIIAFKLKFPDGSSMVILGVVALMAECLYIIIRWLHKMGF